MQATEPGPRIVDVALRHRAFAVDEDRLGAVFHALDRWPVHAVAPGELSIVLTTEQELADLHERFLGDPSPTDVITFPGDPEAAFAGEICLSLDRAEAEASKRAHPPGQEATLYLVHGWLHLAGLRDETAAARAAMREAETAALEYLARGDRAVTDWLRPR
ncbi:MAG: rRNA maturation RNase YbeY [Opitutales bacterium]